MIEIAPDTACMIYLALMILIILFYWHKSNKQLKEKDVVQPSLTSKTCEFCHHQFVDNAKKSLSRCPQCQLFTK